MKTLLGYIPIILTFLGGIVAIVVAFWLSREPPIITKILGYIRISQRLRGPKGPYSQCRSSFRKCADLQRNLSRYIYGSADPELGGRTPCGQSVDFAVIGERVHRPWTAATTCKPLVA